MRYIIIGILSTVIFFITSSSLCSPEIDQFTETIRRHGLKLESPGDLTNLIEKSGGARLVLLGEASHGTSEYYYWRAEISKRLISEKGFSFIAVEGDWASIYRLNLYIKGAPGSGNSAREVMQTFSRWPEWMWANEETAELAEWLRAYNQNLPLAEKIGFYGMDVYGQWEAMDELLAYVSENLPEQLEEVKDRLNCFTAFGEDEWQYARAVFAGGESCEVPLQEVVNILRESKEELMARNPARYFNAKQNAIVLKNAEDYYRLAIRGGVDSWNSRVMHMNKTVNRLLEYYGENAKGIVWAHNTHIGDSYATSMQQHGMVNIGHLTRQEHGRENVFLTGFTTYTGTVMAGSKWGSPRRVMNVPKGMQGSVEQLLNEINEEAFYVVFDENLRQNNALMLPKPHRAIGVVYNPRNEQGNYVQTILPERYDAFFFFRETRALKPLK